MRVLYYTCSPPPPPPSPAAFSLEYYTEVLDLSLLLDHLSDDPLFARYRSLNEALVGLVEDYSLVSFCTLDVQVSGWGAGLAAGVLRVS